jgi:formylglycine-generating enzyme required for sulfatase activity
MHIAHEDAEAYAEWAGRSLPTEAEWEAAARDGLHQAAYTWGDAPEPAAPGPGRTAPVGSFPANGYGLYDMAGNVWEWTSDWYSDRPAGPSGDSCCVPHDPRGPGIGAAVEPRQPRPRRLRKVVKGGSFLCADSYCHRSRPAARRPQTVDTGMSHIGFRCVVYKLEAERTT